MKKNRVIYIAAFGLAIVGIGALVADRLSAAPADSAATQQPVSAQVATQAVEQRSMANSITAFGDIVPLRILGVSSAYPAQVASLMVVQGQKVAKGAPLAMLAADPAAQLAYRQAVSAARLSAAELARTKELLGLGLATQSQLDAAQKASDDAQAAEATQKNLGGAAIAALNAPEDSVVMALTAAQGDRVAAGAPIMQLGVVGGIKILLGIDPSDRRRIAKDAAVKISPLDDADSIAQGKIADIQDAIDPKTQLSNVVVKVDAAGRNFIPGMRVRAEIAAERRTAFIVPRQAVLDDERGAYLFQVADAKARRVNVQVAVDNRELLGVTGAIDARLPVVVQGNYELSDGMQVHGGAK
ncbi:efflux RND transporter periplasmic adaptor subunit [Oxalobacteraceae bacterium CAVE-383]|nr:efflux RND transporter periplasmic adaptor subunit [Oxalobacteraceae bacterium CAVE-383]